MSQFRIELSDLQHGWVTANVSTGEREHTMFVSYVFDGLYHMADATVAFLRPSLTDTVTFSWYSEPGEDQWILRWINTERVSVQIVSFQDLSRRSRDDQGVIIFETECTPIQLLRQVKGQLHQLLNKYGEDGYLLRWHRPFPMSHFRQLEARLEEMKPPKDAT